MYYRIGPASRLSRITTTAVQRPSCSHTHARIFSTVDSNSTRPTTNQSGTPRPQKGRDNNMLYIGGGLAAIGAIWYYYIMQETGRTERESVTAPSQAKASIEDELPRAADDASRSGKDRTQEMLKSYDAKYQEIKSEADLKVREARDRAGKGVERGEQLYKDAKNEAVQFASETRSAAEKKADAAKSSWWGWLGWGKSQTKETADDLRRRANETLDAWNTRFEEAKKKAAERGEDIKQRAGETEEEFRNRIAKAMKRR